jgi:hypothetical protein
MPKPNKDSAKPKGKEKERAPDAGMKAKGKAEAEKKTPAKAASAPAAKTAKPKSKTPAAPVERAKPAPEAPAEIVRETVTRTVEITETRVMTRVDVPPANSNDTAAPPAADASARPPMPLLQSPPGRRFKPVKPPLPAGTLEITIARAKYTVRHMPGAIEVERPRKRDPKNPRIYKFSLKGCEIARKHLAGRSVTLADAAELLKAVKVAELDALEGETRRQATKFLLVALSSRNEAELNRDGDLILVRVPFNAADLA